MNDELERFGRKRSWTKQDTIPEILWSDRKKNDENPESTGIRDFPNTK
jgi:hypothetical protein